MNLPVISIGYAVPNEDFTSSIHSAFQSALNLRSQTDEHLLTLIASGEGDLPQGIRLAVPDGFSFEDFRLGELVVCRNGILHFEENSLNVQLGGARRWRCDLPALKFDPVTPAVAAAWSFVWRALNEQQRLAEADIVAEELLDESDRKGVAHKASQAIRALQSATRRYEPSLSGIEALIGLGSGLTPSGDDLLIGYLTGLWCSVRTGNESRQFVSELGETIIRLSAQTNDISRTYLYHATQGQVSSRLANLAEVICHGRSPEQLGEVAETAFRVGHTSGMDAVTGLLIGLAAWGKPETFTNA